MREPSFAASILLCWRASQLPGQRRGRMPQAPRMHALWIPVLMSALFATGTGCQCTITCSPPWMAPHCGPNGCGGCNGGACMGCSPAGSGQWGPACGNAMLPPGQYGNGAPMGSPGSQQQAAPASLPQPMPDRGSDRMPFTQGSVNPPNSYQGAPASGGNSRNYGTITPYSQGLQGMPFGAFHPVQGNGTMQYSTSRSSRVPDSGELQLPAPRTTATGAESPYSP